jgi:hypothetical protein
MLNLFSTFNAAYIGQTNYQAGANVAQFSPLANQTLVQGASNGAVVYQIG